MSFRVFDDSHNGEVLSMQELMSFMTYICRVSHNERIGSRVGTIIRLNFDLHDRNCAVQCLFRYDEDHGVRLFACHE